MKGFRFYAEMPEERKSKSASKKYPHQPWTRATLKRYASEGKYIPVYAILTDSESWVDARSNIILEGVGSVFSYDDSAVSITSASRDWLCTRTTNIDEATARKLHPRLFERLDADD